MKKSKNGGRYRKIKNQNEKSKNTMKKSKIRSMTPQINLRG
jgi:hypothetical protein